jgi:membrane protein DedA with SNARE-associated domain/rhodanese-related sulfurtransferase
MTHTMEFLLKHGYVVLFVAVMAEQIGLPIPSTPFLLAVGALAGLHRFNLAKALALATLASLISDCIWFYLGKRRGASILSLLCKISLEPDSCVASTQSVYSRYGSKSLLFAKFVPGLAMIAPPIAGMFRLRLWKFMALDAGGAFLWASSFSAVGWIFRDQLEILADSLERFGAGLVGLVAFGLAIYIGSKYVQRRRIYRALRIARITPIELKARMDAGENLTIVDLRSAIERQEGTIPGSIQLKDGDLDSRLASMAGTEIVLYCSCPNEFTSARAALRLKQMGVTRVHPLEGGFPLWRELDFPVEQAQSASAMGENHAPVPDPLAS